jgi:ribosomal protein S12 methylthiotransferase accessory factor
MIRLVFNQTDLSSGGRFEDDLAVLLNRLAAVGVRGAAAVNLSHEEIGVPVVKVVVPGLEPVRASLYRPGPRAVRRMREHAE